MSPPASDDEEVLFRAARPTNPISAPAVSTIDSLANLLAILADNTRCQSLAELRAASVQAQELIGQANQQAAESAAGARGLEAQRQAHAGTVQQERDALAAERAKFQKDVSEQQAQIASRQAALEEEKRTVTDLRQKLEQRLAAIARAPA